MVCPPLHSSHDVLFVKQATHLIGPAWMVQGRRWQLQARGPVERLGMKAWRRQAPPWQHEGQQAGGGRGGRYRPHTTVCAYALHDRRPEPILQCTCTF